MRTVRSPIFLVDYARGTLCASQNLIFAYSKKYQQNAIQWLSPVCLLHFCLWVLAFKKNKCSQVFILSSCLKVTVNKLTKLPLLSQSWLFLYSNLEHMQLTDSVIKYWVMLLFSSESLTFWKTSLQFIILDLWSWVAGMGNFSCFIFQNLLL